VQLLAREDVLPEFCRKRVLVLGCGNVLFGDDGFGPAVVEWLEKHCRVPDDVCVLDAGTGVRTILFTVTLSEHRPAKVIVVDAVDATRRPGELFTLSIDELPPRKIDDFSLHQLPTSNLLKELRDLCGVEVSIVSCQVTTIPDSVCPGLSDALQRAVPKACEMVLAQIRSRDG
jgi:coenzyme F420 hydrogenase subunit delta